jgi:hypothetical protein
MLGLPYLSQLSRLSTQLIYFSISFFEQVYFPPFLAKEQTLD